MESSHALRMLSSRAILEFDELQKKCKNLYSKFSQEHDQNQKLQSQFKQLKRVSLLAVSEYENLMKRFTDEVKSKEEAQSKLKKVEDENKELRKSNSISPNVAILPANSSSGANDGATKGELEGLRGLLNGMKEEIRRTKSDVSKLEGQLADEKRDNQLTQQKLKIGNQQIQQLNRVSVMALDEFQDLRKKYDLEVECRRKAEEYASQLLHNHQSEVRTSIFVNESAPANEKLDSALKEVEDLNRTLAIERSQNEQKVKNLIEELDSSKDNNNAKALEDKMSVALDQIELLQAQLQASEERGHQSEIRVQDLYSRLCRTEAALESGESLAPAPPPPPPPPPPPMPAPMIRKFITRIGGGKKKRGDKAPEKDDPIQDMMKEMMNRIKKGGVLKSKNQMNKDDKSPAMNELADLLTNLKRGQSGGEKKPDEIEKKEKLPEFQQVKLKKISSKAEPPKVADKKSIKDNQLKKKLDKQRQAAEDPKPNEIDENQSASVDSVDAKPRSSSVKSSLISEEHAPSATNVESEMKSVDKDTPEVTTPPLYDYVGERREDVPNETDRKAIDKESPEATTPPLYDCVGEKREDLPIEDTGLDTDGVVTSNEKSEKSSTESVTGSETAAAAIPEESPASLATAAPSTADMALTGGKDAAPSSGSKTTLDRSFEAIFNEFDEFLDN